MKIWLEWFSEIQEAKKLGLTTKEIREWLEEAIKEKDQIKQEA
jgi:DNA-binding transcriptional MerR regulator